MASRPGLARQCRLEGRSRPNGLDGYSHSHHGGEQRLSHPDRADRTHVYKPTQSRTVQAPALHILCPNLGSSFVIPPREETDTKNGCKQGQQEYEEPHIHDRQGWPQRDHHKHGQEDQDDAGSLAGAKVPDKARKPLVLEESSPDKPHVCPSPALPLFATLPSQYSLANPGAKVLMEREPTYESFSSHFVATTQRMATIWRECRRIPICQGFSFEESKNPRNLKESGGLSM